MHTGEHILMRGFVDSFPISGNVSLGLDISRHSEHRTRGTNLFVNIYRLLSYSSSDVPNDDYGLKRAFNCRQIPINIKTYPWVKTKLVAENYQ